MVVSLEIEWEESSEQGKNKRLVYGANGGT